MNFTYLSPAQAFRFPILVSRHLKIRKAKGILKVGNIKPACIMLGFDNIGIFDNKKSRSIWELGQGSLLEFKGKAKIGNGFKISMSGGKLTIGSQFISPGECSIICNHNIQIGNDCLISWDTLIMDTDFHRIYENKKCINPPKGIMIGKNVWIGCRSTLLKGCSIPDGSIIAAGSIVTKTLTEINSIYGGNPIRELKKILTGNDNWPDSIIIQINYQNLFLL